MKANWMRHLPQYLGRFALLVWLCACGPDRSERELAQVIESVERLDPHAAIPARQKRLDALTGLSLRSGPAQKLRALCAKAHGALLKAEREQARAEKAVAALEGKQAGRAAPQMSAGAIADAIAGSNQALARAERLLPQCQSQVAHAEHRQARRRRR